MELSQIEKSVIYIALTNNAILCNASLEEGMESLPPDQIEEFLYIHSKTKELMIRFEKELDDTIEPPEW